MLQVQLKQLEDVISSIKIENENLTNQIKHYVLNEENCMQNIKEAENEKNTISELLLQEIHKREILENSIEELRRNQETFESQISMKDERISTLSTEIERIIRNHEVCAFVGKSCGCYIYKYCVLKVLPCNML